MTARSVAVCIGSGLVTVAVGCAENPVPPVPVAVADVNGVSLPYEVAGDGPPLVLIHGWAVHRGYWDDDVAALAQEYRVVRYDRRGFGEATGKPDLTADPADLKALLDEIGVPRAHLIGHSQGANVALSFAHRYPERVHGLVLFGPDLLPGQQPPSGDDLPAAADWVTIGQTEGITALHEAIGQWAVENFGGSVDETLSARAEALLSTYSGADLLDPPQPSNLVAPAGVAELGAVAAPTLVVYGEDEISFVRAAAELAVEGIPGARRVVIPGAGHAANWQEPDLFASAVLEFLGSLR